MTAFLKILGLSPQNHKSKELFNNFLDFKVKSPVCARLKKKNQKILLNVQVTLDNGNTFFLIEHNLDFPLYYPSVSGGGGRTALGSSKIKVEEKVWILVHKTVCQISRTIRCHKIWKLESLFQWLRDKNSYLRIWWVYHRIQEQYWCHQSHIAAHGKSWKKKFPSRAISSSCNIKTR